jgi:hypothetical protein
MIGVLRAVCDDAGLAQALNRNGVQCGSTAWTKVSVRHFRERHGISAFDARQKTYYEQSSVSWEDFQFF